MRCTLFLLSLLLGGCVSLARPRTAVGEAYDGHATRVSQINNYEADEGRRLLEAAPQTLLGKAVYEAGVAATRKACDFARGVLAEERKALDKIKDALGKPPTVPPPAPARTTP